MARRGGHHLGRLTGEKLGIRLGVATEYVVIVPQSVVVAVQPRLGRLLNRLVGRNTAYPHWQSGVLGRGAGMCIAASVSSHRGGAARAILKSGLTDADNAPEHGPTHCEIEG